MLRFSKHSEPFFSNLQSSSSAFILLISSTMTRVLYFASGISTFPTRLIASASIFASFCQNFWNSGASR